MTINEQVLASMKGMAELFAAKGIQLQLPPLSSKTLGTEYVGFDLGKSLAARFQYRPEFTNPVHMFHGGILCACIDEVLGPLTYMAAERPVVTLEMSVSFLRPFLEKDKYVVVEGKVVSKTKSVLVLTAEVKNPDGKLVAIARNHSVVISEENLKLAH